MFKIDNEKKARIAKEFDVKIESVNIIADEYKKIQDGMKEQYLAHIIRTMEIQLQELTENPMFKIIIKPLPLTKDNLSARAQYQRGKFFLIGYSERLNDIQLRVCLAHELGHLYLIEYINSIDKNANLTEKTNMEPLSTVFGILAILDKNDFYSTISDKQLLHKTWEDVLADFKQLQNRNNGIDNIP
ncbi:hypothetical protein HMPREF9554_00499 [Treponema phagedenis F0421]|uniref:ImmA/IrrE family metallo-endopeptidase n=1 Tax=Treponema phagedenis TaxID=162 RepID=UPI0001F63A62|nr:ImmA/IrrE family metallo-endopeptidase [Treponema phagedenis]EFW38976.1 hypothetical protein HMPREF9554_00499 [Treponema phagedenis F0421]